MTRSTLVLFPIMASLFMADVCRAGDIVFESKPGRTHLLELFTSEGCSSCPPAEAWLSKLKNEPRLWQDFVPVAFHVDYWDHLGWRDPFASKLWTARQSAYSAQWKSSSIYTPGFVLDGQEWRNTSVPAAGAEEPGILRIALTDDKAVASFKPSKGDGRAYEIHVARLGFAININVKAGENSGRKLLHDFVVLGLISEQMTSGTKQIRLPAETSRQGQVADSRTAVAAWVTVAGQLEPIQAVGGWLR